MKADELIRKIRSNREYIWLVSDALNLSSTQILTREKYSDSELELINSLISRKDSGEPLQYIMGKADFYGRDFFVGEGVLIPRHDTETLIEAVKKYFSPDEKFSFLDWGTGSGCIAITILLEYENSSAYILENSNNALKYALKNFERFKVSERVKINSDEIKNLDLIISNPPYIPSDEIQSLDKTVRDYEPHTALDGGKDGMKFYEIILESAMKILKSQGYIIFEIGNIKEFEILKNFNNGFEFCGEFYDTGNFPRCLAMRRK